MRGFLPIHIMIPSMRKEHHVSVTFPWGSSGRPAPFNTIAVWSGGFIVVSNTGKDIESNNFDGKHEMKRWHTEKEIDLMKKRLLQRLYRHYNFLTWFNNCDKHEDQCFCRYQMGMFRKSRPLQNYRNLGWESWNHKKRRNKKIRQTPVDTELRTRI